MKCVDCAKCINGVVCKVRQVRKFVWDFASQSAQARRPQRPQANAEKTQQGQALAVRGGMDHVTVDLKKGKSDRLRRVEGEAETEDVLTIFDGVRRGSGIVVGRWRFGTEQVRRRTA